MRAVVDTNVWISAALSRSGAPARVAEADGGTLIPVTSPATLRERHRAGENAKLLKLGLTPQRLEVLVTRLNSVGERHEDSTLEFELRDPKDAAFVALAGAARADYLVSGDKDILDDDRVRHYLAAHSVQLVTVREFVELLDAADAAT